MSDALTADVSGQSATARLHSWRSLLYLRGHDAEISDMPLGCRPDAVIVDLEDFVPPSDKPRARRNVDSLVEGFSAHGLGVVVRINRPLSLTMLDLDCAVRANVQAIMVTKAMGADHLRLLDEEVSTLELHRGLPAGQIRFVAMIETAEGLRRIDDIATACARTVALTLGAEDLARECRMRATEATLLHAKQTLVQAATAAQLQPWGYLASVADALDDGAFRKMVSRSRDFGFRCASCLRPEQVRAVNELYGPTPGDMKEAA